MSLEGLPSRHPNSMFGSALAIFGVLLSLLSVDFWLVFGWFRSIKQWKSDSKRKSNDFD